MAIRRAQWVAHNSLRSSRPMVLISPEGSWSELLADPLCCSEETAQQIEWQLRMALYNHAHFSDDTVIEKEWKVPAVVRETGWGLLAHHQASSETRGAWGFDPVLKDSSDVKKMVFPEVIFDERATIERCEEMQELFGDILQVQYTGVNYFGFHLTAEYSGWRGLAEMYLDFLVEPQLVHEVMTFLAEGHRRRVQQYVDLNLLRLNNDSTYNGSGGNGYTDDLPAEGYQPECVRCADIWAMAESQEMAAVSPEMHEEFVMQYERRLLEPFGLTAYGCCEPLSDKLEQVFTIPHIRRISISPWADVERSAEKLQNKYIFSWKPQPAHLCGTFDDEYVREYLRHTLEVTRGCVFEMILKDTHTCENHPERFDAWGRIARELVDEFADR